ncbi:MAG: isochorismate synthase [Acidimicrobiales bacterium]|jgi:menaquinone-specific isochorismate synthase|nr:isochorismate synthase [Acidimicrobiales bacterium]
MPSECDNGHQSSSLNNVQSKTFTLETGNHRNSSARQELFWSSNKVTLTGVGTACRIPLQPLEEIKTKSELLGEINFINRGNRDLLPGEGPCAFVAFPFDPKQQTDLIVPRILLGEHASGQRWVTFTSETDLSYKDIMEEIRQEFSVVDSEPIPEISIDSPIEPEVWRDEKLSAVKDLIDAGKVKKVVLARELVLTANKEIPVNTVLGKLRERNKSSMIFNVDGFIGASPELLVSRFGNSVRANPLAGTTTRYSDGNADKKSRQELLDSTKDAYEHKVTIEWLLNELLPFCSFVDADPEPKIVSLPHVHHLGTEVNGQLSQPAASILELVSALHPTPAVAGDPQKEAIEIIKNIEGIDRKRYAGPVGWVDSSGNGEFAVGIRSAEIKARQAHLYAGVGLVADSNPQSELDETTSKFKTMLSTFLDL